MAHWSPSLLRPHLFLACASRPSHQPRAASRSPSFALCWPSPPSLHGQSATGRSSTSFNRSRPAPPPTPAIPLPRLGALGQDLVPRLCLHLQRGLERPRRRSSTSASCPAAPSTRQPSTTRPPRSPPTTTTTATTSLHAIDAGFARLASERIAAHPLRYYLWLPLGRVADMWLRPRVENLPIDLDWWVYCAPSRRNALQLGLRRAERVSIWFWALLGLCLRPRLGAGCSPTCSCAARCCSPSTRPKRATRWSAFPMLFALGGVALVSCREWPSFTDLDRY